MDTSEAPGVGTRRGKASARMGMAGFWKETLRGGGTCQLFHHWDRRLLSEIADFNVVDLREFSGVLAFVGREGILIWELEQSNHD